MDLCYIFLKNTNGESYKKLYYDKGSFLYLLEFIDDNDAINWISSCWNHYLYLNQYTLKKYYKLNTIFAWSDRLKNINDNKNNISDKTKNINDNTSDNTNFFINFPIVKNIDIDRISNAVVFLCYTMVYQDMKTEIIKVFDMMESLVPSSDYKAFPVKEANYLINL